MNRRKLKPNSIVWRTSEGDRMRMLIKLRMQRDTLLKAAKEVITAYYKADEDDESQNILESKIESLDDKIKLVEES